MFFADHTRDRSEAEISIQLVELGCGNPLIVKSSAQRFKPMLVSDRQMDQTWVPILRPAI